MMQTLFTRGGPLKVTDNDTGRRSVEIDCIAVV